MAIALSGFPHRARFRKVSLISPAYTIHSDDAFIIFDGSGTVADVASGIEVAVEASITGSGDPTLWSCTVAVDLSYDGGSTYTSTKTFQMNGIDNGTDLTFTLGSSTDLWGRGSWSETELGNTNFRARLTLTARNDSTTSARVDLIQVKVYDKYGIVAYTPAESTSDSNTGFKAPATTGTPSNSWTNGTNVKVSDDARATESTVSDKLDTSDYSFLNAGVTLTLPAVAAVMGRVYRFKKIDATAAVLTIAPASGLIEGNANVSISAQYGYITLFSDGTSWHIIT